MCPFELFPRTLDSLFHSCVTTLLLSSKKKQGLHCVHEIHSWPCPAIYRCLWIQQRILLQEITNKAVVFFLKTFGSIYFSCLFPMSSSIKIQYLSLYYLECISLLRQTSCHHKTQTYRENKTGRGAIFSARGGRLHGTSHHCCRLWQDPARRFGPLLPLAAGGLTRLRAGGNGPKRCVASCRERQQQHEAPCGLLPQAAETV